jgi:MerR family transcriptional regulator, light-induced transcriptional regulator
LKPGARSARSPAARSGKDTGWVLAAVVRETGIGPHTLRVWERRFGFPEPDRLPSGHRRYPKDQVDRLRLISRALALGHRAGDAVPASPSRLKAMAGEDDPSPGSAGRLWRAEVLNSVLGLDRPRTSLLLSQAAADGVRPFLSHLDTLFEEVGAAWAAGRLEIAQEHFLSELAEDLLRGLRAPLEARLSGPALLLASLPGEQHTLGLQAVALRAAASGVPVQLLGAQSPAEEIARAASRSPTLAVGLSISPAAVPRATVECLNRLAQALPAEVELWAGGAGSLHLRGLSHQILRVGGPTQLERDLTRLAGQIRGNP